MRRPRHNTHGPRRRLCWPWRLVCICGEDSHPCIDNPRVEEARLALMAMRPAGWNEAVELAAELLGLVDPPEPPSWAAPTTRLPIISPWQPPEPPREVAPLLTRAQRARADQAFGRW